MELLDATPDTFDALVYDASGLLVVVYFWGPDCPNCDFFASRFPKLLDALEGEPIRIVKVNAYEHDAIATRHAIFGIPQFHLFREGQRIGKMSEFRGDAFFTAVLREHLPAST